jgi:MinD superfamily P-loop ATPase
VSLIIAVASGKGGTGKTTVAVNLALSLGDIRLLDCDVEEPNSHLLLEIDETESIPVTLPTPVVDQDACTLCGDCGTFCEFNAIFVGKKKVLVYDEICHSCGGCKLVCPENAISENPREVGTVYITKAGTLELIYGLLNIGEPIATSIIKAVKSHINPDGNYIIDAPPGTACPVVETVRDSDFVVLVTEPTPFGLHDLSMTVEVMKELTTPFGVIINRSGIGDNRTREYCTKNNIPILLEIPFDRKIAELYSKGIPFVQEMPEWRERFLHLYDDIKERVNK